MSNVLLMHVIKCEKELPNYIGSRPLADTLHFDDVVIELATSHKLRHDIEVCIVLEQFKDSDHVRVISFR